MRDYHINVLYSDEDESYIADIPDFLMCSAHGMTPEGALHKAIIAKNAILEVDEGKRANAVRTRL